jgi:hypothetical protein
MLSEVPGHTSYRLDLEPMVNMLWTYAEWHEDGYRRGGGGGFVPNPPQ